MGVNSIPGKMNGGICVSELCVGECVDNHIGAGII